MHIVDEIARRKLKLVRQDVRDGCGYTRPWLDLDVEAYRAYRTGEKNVLPRPYCDKPEDRMMMERVQGQRVLCLAGGGGQHSAVFALLGADVTVLDLTPEQLEADQHAARHYGLQIITRQGDMRDLSAFPGDHFYRVYQPISTLFIPDLREVYAGVARVLQPGGLYLADYAVPLLHLAQDKGWDGQGYTLYVTEPYVRGAILETEDGRMNYSHGESFSEFHHLLSDIINNLVAEGFLIRGLWENPRPDSGPPLEELAPGSEAHRARYIPYGLRVVAEKQEHPPRL
jgi:ubiquinone/menaquinone biosynthesis C-methylase UbiE